MKKWLKTIVVRTGDLVVKLISVKTIPAAITSVIALKDGSSANVVLMCLMWALLVGFRYAEKVAGLVKKD
jgi:hypothetical protein